MWKLISSYNIRTLWLYKPLSTPASWWNPMLGGIWAQIPVIHQFPAKQRTRAIFACLWYDIAKGSNLQTPTLKVDTCELCCVCFSSLVADFLETLFYALSLTLCSYLTAISVYSKFHCSMFNWNPLYWFCA